MFIDKVYEEMDHLTKLVEEYEDELSDKLATIPNTVKICQLPPHVLLSNKSLLDVELLLNSSETIEEKFSSTECRYLINQGILILDKESIEENTLTMQGDYAIFAKPLIISKTQHRLKAEQILDWAAKSVKIATDAKAADLNDLIRAIIPDNMNEEALKTRSLRKKCQALQGYIEKEVVRANRWNIRNTMLFRKLSQWVYGASQGNLACKANIMKLACMRHNGHGIYSMEEIV